jgi:hypothetical protein
MGLFRRITALVTSARRAPAPTRPIGASHGPEYELNKAISGLRYLSNKLDLEAASEDDERGTLLSQLLIAIREDEDEVALVMIVRWDHLEKAAVLRAADADKLT